MQQHPEQCLGSQCLNAHCLQVPRDASLSPPLQERDSACGVAVQVDDQGLVNTDPRNIAVPNTWVNLIPTDVRGLTFSRTPQMVRAPPPPPPPALC